MAVPNTDVSKLLPPPPRPSQWLPGPTASPPPPDVSHKPLQEWLCLLLWPRFWLCPSSHSPLLCPSCLGPRHLLNVQTQERPPLARTPSAPWTDFRCCVSAFSCLPFPRVKAREGRDRVLSVLVTQPSPAWLRANAQRPVNEHQRLRQLHLAAPSARRLGTRVLGQPGGVACSRQKEQVSAGPAASSQCRSCL